GYTFTGWYTEATGGMKVEEIAMGTMGDMTLYAHWNANSYSVEFDVDGGIALDSLTVTFDQEFVLPKPEREGYSFAGWSYNGNAFHGGVWKLDQNITILALWTEWPLISFESGEGSPVQSISQEPGTIVTEPSDPTRTGYTFSGWYEDLELTTAYTFSTMPGESITLYARWIANLYLVTFNTNGGDSLSEMIVTYDESFTLPNATKTGHTFSQWKLNGEAFPISGVWNIPNNVFLDAIYDANDYVITFNTNGGDLLSEMIVAYGESFTLPNATKAGYSFSYWQWDDEAFSSGIWEMAYDVILGAIYEVEAYEITYLNLSGTTQTNPGSYNIETPTFNIGAPTNRTGYTFTGWYTEATGGMKVEEIAMGTMGDMTLYARWTPIVYSINYENVFSTTHSNPASYQINSTTIILNNPTARTGYNFVGWYTALDGGDIVTEISSGSTGNRSVYARWSAKNYTITFNIDGILTTLMLPYDSEISANDVPIIPTKEHYDVIAPSWDNDPINHLITGNVTFTAVYVGNPMTISFNTGGGSLMDPMTVSYGSLLSQPFVPLRSGYTFIAWYSDSNLTVLVDFNEIVTTDLTLYAAWELNFVSWDVEAIFLREDLNDPNIVITDPNQGAILSQMVNLYYGLEISPVQVYEGYTFDYFVYDGVEYSNEEQLIMVTDDRLGEDRIQVFYRKIILTITFAQDPDLFSPENVDDAIVTFRVYYNTTFLIENGPSLVGESESIHVVWDQTQFSNVKSNLAVYALYYMTGVKTVTFIDRGVIKYIASAIDDLGHPILEVIGTDSILWDMYRPGYKFLGWYTAETGGSLISRADLLFSDFEGERTSLYARWEALTPFSEPTNLGVVASETEIVISWDIDPILINGVSPIGFEFIVNNRIIADLSTIPSLNGNTFTLTLVSSNPEFALFEDLLDPGYHQLSIRALGDEIHHYHSDYSDDYIFSNESVFDGDPTEVAIYDYFIIETFGNTKRYIFYTNLDYQFGSSYQFEIVTGQEFATANQNRIITKNMSGSFKFRMIREGYPTVVYDALVVHDIKQFTYGSNYQNFLQAKDPETNVFLNLATTYYVGSANEFHVDLRMINNQGSRIPLVQTYLDYELYEWVSDHYEHIPEAILDNYIELLPDNELKLKPLTLNKSYKLIVKPKYQSTRMTVDPLEFVFTVNDGVNVYDNQELKEAYGDFDVNTINIHASFMAELSNDQKNADGSPINRDPNPSNPTSGSVYQRFSTTIDDDQLTIEGNFMTIDGSELPFSNANSGSGTVGFAQSFEIISVQVAVFLYSVKDQNLGTINNNQFHMNNLVVKGNTSIPYIDFTGTAEEIEIQERLMSKNSGGYNGVIVRSGTAELNNLFVFNTVIAVTNNAFGENTLGDPTYITLDYLKTDNIWANTLYLHSGAGWIVKNSAIGQSGGSAIHLVDTHPAVFDESGNKISDRNPYLELHDSTTINNWVSGEEAWFKAYGMSQVALTLKSGIETGIAGTERSIVNLIEDPLSGLDTEKLNFILLTEPSSGANVYLEPEQITLISGSEVILKLGGNQTHRPFDFFTSPVAGFPFVDQRITGGQFAFPVGEYSEFADFYQLIVDLRGMGVSEADAPNLATLGAFYGLTATEALNTIGVAQMNSISFRQALAITVPGKQYPQYIEVLAQVPVFANGYSSVIIQFDE
ncbi:MAG: InlB B-repeat-containing protein, partial [Candidatus Izemoplasmatales bacterium]|nr:InlB B-repeat-containing protein [Candidatus Izemoplasmatales bacterium]